MATQKTVGKVTRKKGMLYFVDGSGNVKETPMKRTGSKTAAKKTPAAKKKAATKKKAAPKRKTTPKKRTAAKRK